MKAIVPFDLIRINPLRDLTINPINMDKANKIAKSIRDLKWWDNLVARPAGNSVNGEVMTPEELEAYLIERDYVMDVPVEIPYGAHRHKAIEIHNYNPIKNDPIEFLEMSINIIPDDMMLSIMVEENSSEWKHSTSTMVESVKQVYRKISEQIQEFTEEEFELYKEQYGHVAQEAEFKKILRGSKDIGPTPIQAFLGGRMPEEDLRGAIAAIKLSDKGYVDLEDLYVISSGSSLRWTCDLVLTIHVSKDIPQLVKDTWTETILSLFDDKVTKLPGVKALKTAKALFLKGNDPTKYLLLTTTVPFKINNYLARLFLEGEVFDVKDVMAKYSGLEGFEKEVIEGIEGAIKLRDRKIAKNTVPGEPGDVPSPGDVQSPGTIPSPTVEPTPQSEPKVLARGSIVLSANTVVTQGSAVIEHLNILIENSTEVAKDHPKLFHTLSSIMDRTCFLVEEVLGSDVISDTLTKLSESYGSDVIDPEYDPENDPEFENE